MTNVIPWDGYIKDRFGNDITTDDIVVIERGKYKGELAILSEFEYTFHRDIPGLYVTTKLYRLKSRWSYPMRIKADGVVLYKKGQYNLR